MAMQLDVGHDNLQEQSQRWFGATWEQEAGT
jgi:hypothetical protein